MNSGRSLVVDCVRSEIPVSTGDRVRAGLGNLDVLEEVYFGGNSETPSPSTTKLTIEHVRGEKMVYNIIKDVSNRWRVEIQTQPTSNQPTHSDTDNKLFDTFHEMIGFLNPSNKTPSLFRILPIPPSSSIANNEFAL